MEQKLSELMAEFHQSKYDIDKRLAESKYKVATTQEKTSLDLSRKISSSLYQFKKIHKHQNLYNTGLADTLDSTKAELGWL